jgi:hypothetical protein
VATVKIYQENFIWSIQIHLVIICTNISKCFKMWWKTVLPQSRRTRLLTSTMV